MELKRNRNRAEIAKILLSSGYSRQSVLSFIEYPKIERIRISSKTTNATQAVKLVGKGSVLNIDPNREIVNFLDLEVGHDLTHVQTDLKIEDTQVDAGVSSDVINVTFSDRKMTSQSVGRDMIGDPSSDTFNPSRFYKIPKHPQWPKL